MMRGNHCGLHRSRNLQCQRIFQVNAPINCVCLHPNQVRRLTNIDFIIFAMWCWFTNCLRPNVVRKPSQVLFLFFQGGADCWRPEWRDSHLGSEDRPQRAAHPGARGLGQLRPHRPRCQLHGGSQQLGELSDTVLVERFYFFIVNLKLTEASLLFSFWPLFYQGNCYVWNLAGGIGEEVTQMIPKTKIPAHNRYSLRCKFSPDSTWVSFTIHRCNYHVLFNISIIPPFYCVYPSYLSLAITSRALVTWHTI